MLLLNWSWPPKPFHKLARVAIATCALLAGQPALAQYYIGPSYLNVPGIAVSKNGVSRYRTWVRAEANYWTLHPPVREIRGISGKYNSLKFTPSRTPVKGPDVLSLAIDKRSPSLASLMAKCTSKEVLPRLVYAESAELARHPQEHGPRPSDLPEYSEYALSNVRLTCPIVAGAPEQAFQLHFDSIQWLNRKPETTPRELAGTAARLAPVTAKGERKTFVISWFAPISDSRDDQCATMNPKPTQDDYYALMSPARAAEQRARLADKGGASTIYLPYRGPDEMNVTMLPGIVASSPFFAPTAQTVQGFDLDNDDGSRKGRNGVKDHVNFVSPDGRRGIDNQLFTVQGCVAGWRRTGFLPLIGNELRRAGGLSIIVQVSGIDDAQNDNDVAVTIYYSTDPIRRDGTSKIVLPDFTFRINETTEYSQDFVRFKGRIVNGVVTTSPATKIFLHEGSGTTWSLADARMRLEFKPDGTMAATLGGYRDWREYLAAAFFRSSDYENTIGFQAPAMYKATREAADGLRDPVTGEFEGISAAYEMIGVPAYLPPAQELALLAGRLEKPTGGAKLAETPRPPIVTALH